MTPFHLPFLLTVDILLVFIAKIICNREQRKGYPSAACSSFFFAVIIVFILFNIGSCIYIGIKLAA